MVQFHMLQLHFSFSSNFTVPELRLYGSDLHETKNIGTMVYRKAVPLHLYPIAWDPTMGRY